jgi:hypothetical protein
MTSLPCKHPGEFIANDGCPCDSCLLLQRRRHYGVLLEEIGAPAELSSDWDRVWELQEKIAAVDREIHGRYFCQTHGKYSDLFNRCPKSGGL